MLNKCAQNSKEGTKLIKVENEGINLPTWIEASPQPVNYTFKNVLIEVFNHGLYDYSEPIPNTYSPACEIDNYYDPNSNFWLASVLTGFKGCIIAVCDQSKTVYINPQFYQGVYPLEYNRTIIEFIKYLNGIDISKISAVNCNNIIDTLSNAAIITQYKEA